MAADEIGVLLHGKGAVAIMGLDLNRFSSLEREQGFEAELSKNFPAIHVVGRRSGSVNLAQEQQIGQELLSLPDKVDALVALSAASTRGSVLCEVEPSCPTATAGCTATPAHRGLRPGPDDPDKFGRDRCRRGDADERHREDGRRGDLRWSSR